MSENIIPEETKQVASDVEQTAEQAVAAVEAKAAENKDSETNKEVEPVAEADAPAEPETKAEPVAEVEAPAEPETKAEPVAEAKAEEPETKAEPVAEAEAPAEPGTKAEPVAEAKAEEPETKAEPVAEADAPAEPETKAEPAAKAEEPGTKAEPVAEVEAPAEPETKAEPVAEAGEPEAKTPAFDLGNLADKTLAELSELFVQLKDHRDAMNLSKEAEAIKSAFYKLLLKLKGENPEVAESQMNNPFEQVEENFKALYADYKKERAEFNKAQEAQREENLKAKQQVIEDLKQLVDKQEDVSATFPEFRAIQDRWRAIGPVPATAFRNLNDSYQFYVEKFYDMVKINRDLRDLDFRKNLEAKQAFCEAAEKLAENENIVNAFHELQKLHEQWKEFGPVAKEFREDIWNRFKAATAVINKNYQSHFEELKGQQSENLTKKTALCEKIEEIAAKAEEGIKDSNVWNALTKDIESIQAEWRTIGFASKKDNQKIYDRFRASCDKFFEKKREFYTEFKDDMNENLQKKLDIIKQAEELKTSTDWKKTSDQLIALQKQWKEIGAVPRKKSEQLWKRFRAACDEFFDAKAKNVKPENDFYGNLKAKKALIDEILAFTPEEGQNLAEAMQNFQTRFNEIGFVPFKEKDNIAKAFKEAMQDKFPEYGQRHGAARHSESRPHSAQDALIQKYHTLQQDIITYENNIGFFSASKNSEPLIRQMQERIDAAKAELKELEAKIREAEEAADKE